MTRRLIGRRAGGRVQMDGREIIMLGSNDYLGLSTDPRVIAATGEAMALYGSGVCLYPLFATTALHENLCDGLATYLETEAAMLFSSGGSANAGALATLVGEGDVILSDRLNHASIIDGCRLSRADVVSYDNRNVENLREKLMQTAGAKRKLIVTDGIFSMEGGAAPLREIHALAREFDAMLMVDEAHATGVVGPQGAGTATMLGLHNNLPGLVLTGSLSKALGGASGGFVAASRATIELLQAKSRSWIFTMGMTSANAATALAALDISRNDQQPLARLWDNLRLLRSVLSERKMKVLDSDSAITALMIGNEAQAQTAAAALLDNGVYAPAITYPVVAKGEARLRIQVSAAHDQDDLVKAADIMSRCVLEA